jgi:biopolymer transport protein ExbD
MGRMRRVRRTSDDVHIELTPMIDVVFLLLTFFVFSIVLMVRADVLDVKLPELSAGRSADRVIPITIAITETGDLLINAQPIQLSAVVDEVRKIQTQIENSPIVIAVDTRSEAGVMITLADTLTSAGLREFSVIGSRKEEPFTTSTETGSSESSSSADLENTESPAEGL